MKLLFEPEWLRTIRNELSITVDVVPGEDGKWEFVDPICKRVFKPSEELSVLMREKMTNDSATRLRVWAYKLPLRPTTYKVETLDTRGGDWMRQALGLEVLYDGSKIQLWEAREKLKGLRRQVLTELKDSITHLEREREACDSHVGQWDGDSRDFITGEINSLETTIENLASEWELSPQCGVVAHANDFTTCVHGTIMVIKSIETDTTVCPECSENERTN